MISINTSLLSSVTISAQLWQFNGWNPTQLCCRTLNKMNDKWSPFEVCCTLQSDGAGAQNMHESPLFLGADSLHGFSPHSVWKPRSFQWSGPCYLSNLLPPFLLLLLFFLCSQQAFSHLHAALILQIFSGLFPHSSWSQPRYRIITEASQTTFCVMVTHTLPCPIPTAHSVSLIPGVFYSAVTYYHVTTVYLLFINSLWREYTFHRPETF